jgi:hypothetical protein
VRSSLDHSRRVFQSVGHVSHINVFDVAGRRRLFAGWLLVPVTSLAALLFPMGPLETSTNTMTEREVLGHSESRRKLPLKMQEID